MEINLMMIMIEDAILYFCFIIEISLILKSINSINLEIQIFHLKKKIFLILLKLLLKEKSGLIIKFLSRIF